MASHTPQGTAALCCQGDEHHSLPHKKLDEKDQLFNPLSPLARLGGEVSTCTLGAKIVITEACLSSLRKGSDLDQGHRTPGDLGSGCPGGESNGKPQKD